MKKRQTETLRKKLSYVPMPKRGWEYRMASYILNYKQEKQNPLVNWIGRLGGLFYRYKLLAPILAIAFLGLSYFIQPIHLYQENLAQREEAILYFEEMTHIADYEMEWTEWSSSWIIDY